MWSTTAWADPEANLRGCTAPAELVLLVVLMYIMYHVFAWELIADTCSSMLSGATRQLLSLSKKFLGLSKDSTMDSIVESLIQVITRGPMVQ